MAAIDLEVLARLARAGLATGDLYAYCRIVPVLIESTSDHTEWILGYLRALTKLGLNTAARQLIERSAMTGHDDQTMRNLAVSIRNAPPGQIAWNSRRLRFAANLKALERRDAETAEAVREAWPSAAEHYELHQCSDGNYQVREAASDWPPRWLPSLDDHRSRAGQRVNTAATGIAPPALLFEGIGLGWEILEGYAKTAKVFLEASSPIYLVEHHPEALAIALHLHDWRDLLDDPRVLWFVGAGANDRLREWLDSDATWPLAERYCATPLIARPADRSPAITVVGEVSTRRQQRVREVQFAVDERYAGRNAAWWSRRFAQALRQDGRATDRPLRVLGFTSMHTTFLQHSMRDCLRALKRLGHRTQLLIEPAPHRYHHTLSCLDAELGFEPDVILLLSRMRYESHGALHAAIPSITWDQDTLPWVFDPARRPQLAWNDFLMGFAARDAGPRFGWPEHRCRHCAMVGSRDTYSSEPVPAAELEPYRCDVSYVSHASATAEQELASVAGWLPNDRFRAIFRAAVAKLLPEWLAGGVCPGPVMTAVLDAAVECGAGPLSWDGLCKLAPPVHRIAGRAFRHVALDWVADWANRTGRTFHLWGNGWEKHPRLARYARGPAENGQELRCIYQASRINLQLIGTGFFHQRALDGLMAGGFFMGRRSDADHVGPVLREVVSLVERYGITTASDLAALPDAEAKQKIQTGLLRFGEDERAICPEWIESRCPTARDDCLDEKIPHFEEILFASATEFEQEAERFLADPALRREHADRMRTILVENYSYDARMSQMLLFLRDGFRIEAEQPAEPSQAPCLSPA